MRSGAVSTREPHRKKTFRPFFFFARLMGWCYPRIKIFRRKFFSGHQRGAFFLLKKYASAGQHPTQAKQFACFSRAHAKTASRRFLCVRARLMGAFHYMNSTPFGYIFRTAQNLSQKVVSTQQNVPRTFLQSRILKKRHKRFFSIARLMGADPTTSRVHDIHSFH